MGRRPASSERVDFADGLPCGDATAVDPEGVYTMRWDGTYEEQLASAQPQVGFAPAGIVDAAGGCAR